MYRKLSGSQALSLMSRMSFCETPVLYSVSSRPVGRARKFCVLPCSAVSVAGRLGMGG